MPGYFLDTSALGKHYHLEAGTPDVDAIFQTSGAQIYISRLAFVEFRSAFARKVRNHRITGELLKRNFKMKRTILLLSLAWLCCWTAAVAQSIPPSLHARILQLEDERNLNGDELAKLLKHASPKVRERAALAIGRIGDKRGTAALIELLQSEKDEQVRAMAAFALGEMEDAQAVPSLLAFLEPGKFPIFVRARPAEALGKIASIPANIELLGKTTIEQINGRLIEQLPGLKYTPTVDKMLLASLTITALMRVRSPYSVEPLTLQLKSDDADVRSQAANALARIRQPIASAVPALMEALNDSDHNVRANAARALGVSKDVRAVEPLIKLLNDKNEQVQVSTVRALAAIEDKRAVESLLELLQPKDSKPATTTISQNLQLEIAAAHGTLKDERALPPLLNLRRSFSRNRIPEIEIAIARLNEGRLDVTWFKSNLDDLTKNACRNWKQASVFAQTINAMLPTKDGNFWAHAWYNLSYGLLAKIDKPECDPRALPVALRAYGNVVFNPAHLSFLSSLKSRDAVGNEPTADVLSYFHKKLENDDMQVRAAAATILGGQAKPESLAPLIAALQASENDINNDAKLAILTALSKFKFDQAVEAIRTTLNDSDHLVRRRAVELLKQVGAGDYSDRIGIVRSTNKRADYQRVVARMSRKVTAKIHTAKGAITIELFKSEAPLTVDSFITLARRGYFNNLTFHRVVPNFVIQGGDPRGDGEGGPGYQIRCEVNTRPYVRGAVGMALSGKDTGGSQFFITHSPQPHLDGGYTVFGQVTSGMEVVDRIVRGDLIKRIVITER